MVETRCLQEERHSAPGMYMTQLTHIWLAAKVRPTLTRHRTDRRDKRAAPSAGEDGSISHISVCGSALKYTEIEDTSAIYLFIVLWNIEMYLSDMVCWMNHPTLALVVPTVGCTMCIVPRLILPTLDFYTKSHYLASIIVSFSDIAFFKLYLRVSRTNVDWLTKIK